MIDFSPLRLQRKNGPHIQNHSIELVTLTEFDQLVRHELRDQSVGQQVEDVSLGGVRQFEGGHDLDARVQSSGGLHELKVDAMLAAYADSILLLLIGLLGVQQILTQIVVEVKAQLRIELFVVHAEL